MNLDNLVWLIFLSFVILGSNLFHISKIEKLEQNVNKLMRDRASNYKELK